MSDEDANPWEVAQPQYTIVNGANNVTTIDLNNHNLTIANTANLNVPGWNNQFIQVYNLRRLA